MQKMSTTFNKFKEIKENSVPTPPPCLIPGEKKKLFKKIMIYNLMMITPMKKKVNIPAPEVYMTILYIPELL